MDYILWSILISSIVSFVVLSYDVTCQWSKNFFLCGEQFSEHMKTSLHQMMFQFFVPKFHLRAHGQSCQAKYLFNYWEHTGRTDGKGIESFWVHINPITMSTREMTAEFWMDTIDIYVSIWNWIKIIGLGLYLANKLEAALSMHDCHTMKFMKLSTLLDAKTLTE